MHPITIVMMICLFNFGIVCYNDVLQFLYDFALKLIKRMNGYFFDAGGRLVKPRPIKGRCECDVSYSYF